MLPSKVTAVIKNVMESYLQVLAMRMCTDSKDIFHAPCKFIRFHEMMEPFDPFVYTRIKGSCDCGGEELAVFLQLC